jgi:hypothetical protein
MCTETSAVEVFNPKRSSPHTVTNVSLVGAVHGACSCGLNTMMIGVAMHIAAQHIVSGTSISFIQVYVNIMSQILSTVVYLWLSLFIFNVAYVDWFGWSYVLCILCPLKHVVGQFMCVRDI